MTGNLSKQESLKNRLQQILNSEDLDTQRKLISTIAAELGIDSLTCAAALTYLTQAVVNTSTPEYPVDKKTGHQSNTPLDIKMVRYRLDVGSKHQVTLEQLKKVLVEESGVDRSNINNINIQNLYTLIELPDEMPPDIFQHLKSVEINQHKLDIRRVKTRNKKRGNNYIRRGRKRDPKPVKEISNQVNSNKIETIQPRIDTDAH
jgi:hypothetical protein